MQTLKIAPNFQYLETSFPQIKAILWDMDGTILNTEHLHFDSIVRLVESLNNSRDWKNSQFEEYCLGNTDQEVFGLLEKDALISDLSLDHFLARKEEIFQLLVKESLPDQIVLPEIKNLIQQAKLANIKQAVVTSSEKVTAEFLLQYAGLTDFFEFIQTREDTVENKPSPLPYQVAMEKLQLGPSEVLIFEDSKLGLAAAQASKANAIKAGWY